MMPGKHIIWGCKGCGSAIAEAFFSLADIEYERKEVDYTKPSPELDELKRLNLLAQVPTVILPSGEVLTETLAIAHYVDSLAPQVGLVCVSDAQVKFLRWSTFLVTAIYPTFTYGDDPKKWTGSEESGKALRASTDEHRKKLWLFVESQAEEPYFLGEEFSAIDVYIGVMVNWRPGKEWFQENCPKLAAIAEQVAELPDLKETWKLNFEPS